ncbi:MAG: hypothetical protein WDZ63_11095 [Burkholderiales bacterium]
MDSYIVRIYRRTTESGREVAGLVERVGNGRRRAFGTSEELWAFLTERMPAKTRKLRLHLSRDRN